MRPRLFHFMPLLSGMLLSCINAPPFVCTEDAQCNSDPPGICVRFDQVIASCAVPDTSCPSQYRYHESAQPDQIGKCATVPLFDVQTTVTASVDEHKSFSLHVTAKDNNGQKLVNYTGKPNVSTNWGDTKIISAGDFVAGEADFSISLNRETNDVEGPAHILLQDGVAKGRSLPIIVKAPKWDPDVSVHLVPSVPPPPGTPPFPKLNSDFAVATVGDKFFMVAQGATDANLSGFYVAASDTLQNLRISSSPAILPADPKFVRFIAPSLLIDGDLHLLSYSEFNTAASKITFQLRSSLDGTNWSNDFFPLVPWKVDSSVADKTCAIISSAPVLLRDGDRYRIYYRSQDGEISDCTAESGDQGKHWIKGSVLVWTSSAIPLKSVIKEGSVYKGWSPTGAYATSGDGIHWTASTSSPAPGGLIVVVQSPGSQKLIGFPAPSDGKISTVSRL